MQLDQFAFGHHANRVGKYFEDRKAAVFDDHGRRAPVEKVARQHRAPVAPDRIRRRLSAAQLGEVHDIIVKQGGGVDEFECGSELNTARPRVATEFGRKQNQNGSQSLAPGREHVVADQRHQLAHAVELFVHGVIDEPESFGHAGEQLTDARIERFGFCLGFIHGAGRVATRAGPVKAML